MKSVLVLAFGALAALTLAMPAHAADFTNIVLSATKGGTAQTEFPADTPVIYISTDLVDIPATSTITFSWISVDSHGVAPANYTIDKVDLHVGENNEANSQFSKPTAGWPVGTYRVDLAIDGTVAESAPFSVP